MRRNILKEQSTYTGLVYLGLAGVMGSVLFGIDMSNVLDRLTSAANSFAAFAVAVMGAAGAAKIALPDSKAPPAPDQEPPA